jgi:hypothetical protein
VSTTDCQAASLSGDRDLCEERAAGYCKSEGEEITEWVAVHCEYSKECEKYTEKDRISVSSFRRGPEAAIFFL